MQIRAVFTLTGGRRIPGDLPEPIAGCFAKEFLSGSSPMMVDVLGQTLLDRALNRVRQVSDAQPSVISKGLATNQVYPSRSVETSGFIAAWESAIAHQIQRGVDQLLLIQLSAYTEVDYGELLQFHTETQSPLTQVYGTDGSLDITVVDAALLRGSSGAYRKTLKALITQQRRFVYRGYLNRLNCPQDFRKLAEDGLRGLCGLHPVGTEVQPHVWRGPGARVDSSAVIHGPAFIGSGSRISAYCTVAGASAIERNCTIDCGATINESCILQNTYVGLGLDVRRSIVTSKKLFHLDRGVEVVCDRRLLGPSARVLPSFRSLRPSLRG